MSKNTKILVLSHISELLGGAERSMLDIFDDWNRHYKITPEFIIRKPAGSLVDEFKKRGWKHYELEYTFWSHTKLPERPEEIHSHASQNGKTVLEIESIIQKTNPDVIMTNSIVCPWAAIAAYYQQKPHVWFVREYGDLDHGRVYEIGRQETLEDVGNLSELVVTNSRTLASHVEKYINKDKVTTIYTPYDFTAADEKSSVVASSPYSSDSSLKLIMVGGITESKGQMDAVKAMGVLKSQGVDSEICFVGSDGPKQFMKELHTEITKHGLKRAVHFVGQHSNPHSYIMLADVGIMASRSEAFGRVTFEYIATGKPVVGAKSGATPEMVIDGGNGYLYKSGDYEDLATKLKRYADNASLKSVHGKAGRKHAEEMMRGEYNTRNLFSAVQKAIKDYPTKKQIPIHFTHRFIEYQNLASRNVLSVKRLALLRAKQRAKSPYVKLKNLTKKTKQQ